MKKVFSYSLFEPKHLPSHRSWDKWRNDNKRYWFNIPSILLINKLLYHDYEMYFYLSPNIWDNPLSDIFNIFDNVKTITINREYNFTEPAIWRMMPLWERNIEVFHPRDVDSLTNDLEYKFIKEFESSDCLVGTIRSHENHYGILCRMLAGLSSFKPNKINPAIKGYNFDFYYSLRGSEYGSDQNLIIKLFTKNEEFTKDYFLDCKINRQNNSQDFPCKIASLHQHIIDDEKQKIFNLINKNTNSTWLGEPCDSRGELLNYFLNLYPSIKEKIVANNLLSEFYRV